MSKETDTVQNAIATISAFNFDEAQLAEVMEAFDTRTKAVEITEYLRTKYNAQHTVVVTVFPGADIRVSISTFYHKVKHTEGYTNQKQNVHAAKALPVDMDNAMHTIIQRELSKIYDNQ